MPPPPDVEPVGNQHPQPIEQTVDAEDPIIPASPEPTTEVVRDAPVIPASQEPSVEKPTATTEEVDVWWGAFSGWTMLPSWILSATTASLIWWAAIVFVEDELIRSLCLVFAGGILLLQAFRWVYRFFGLTYRLTTQRLFQGKGFLYGRGTEMKLSTVAKVTPLRNAMEAMLGVGRVLVESTEKTQPPILLEGVSKPKLIAELIRSYTKCDDHIREDS